MSCQRRDPTRVMHGILCILKRPTMRVIIEKWNVLLDAGRGNAWLAAGRRDGEFR